MELKGWVIYKSCEKSVVTAHDWMVEEGRNSNLEIKIMFLDEFRFKIHDGKIDIFYEGKVVDVPSFVLFRCYDDNLFSIFTVLNIRCFNVPEGMRLCQNKWKTHLILSQNNIPTPKTLLSFKNHEYKEMKKELGHKFIAKGVIGSGGKEVYLVQDEESFMKAVENLMDNQVIFQEFIKRSYGKDIRAYVVGGEVKAAVVRKSHGDFRSNFSLGGEAEEFKAIEEINELAVRASKSLGLEIAGVDILFGSDDYVVCEVNGNAGFRTIWQYTDVSIPKHIMEYISSEMNK